MPDENENENEQTDVESGENSLLEGDEGYVGVSSEYQNAAYESSKPLKSEDKNTSKLETQAKEAEVETARKGEDIGRLGYTVDATHPTERKNLADEALKNRARLDEEARQEVRTASTQDDDDEEETQEETQPRTPFGR